MSIIVADSLDPADVQDAMDLASAGDTVQLPAGTGNWTSNVTWTAPANVTLMGAGTSAAGGGDQTIIIDDFNSASPLLSITVSATGAFRMTGITFRTNDNNPVKENGELIISGPGSGVSGAVRVDHCHFDNHTNSGASEANKVKLLFLVGDLTGVLDHCLIDANGVSAIYTGNKAGASGRGDETWAAPTNFGSNEFFFFEDNIYTGTAAGPIRTGDTFTGGKVVLRFNNIIGSAGQEEHATGASGDGRGARAVESYGNSFEVLAGQEANPPRCIANKQAGPSMLWGNAVEAEALQNMFMFDVTRSDDDAYAQTATPNGWGYAGTEFNGTGSNWDQNTSIPLGYTCIDQPGRGQGDLLSGAFPTKVNDTTGTIAWPNQAVEPIYIWSNTGLVPHPGYGGAVYSDQSGGRVLYSRDYYKQASGIQTSPSSPFDGTTTDVVVGTPNSGGCGWGTLANRPTTCQVGVAYWATDQGSWNQSVSNPYGVQQNGASGVLYVCEVEDTWTLYYTPYTYPHPLQQDVAPSLPGNPSTSAMAGMM